MQVAQLLGDPRPLVTPDDRIQDRLSRAYGAKTYDELDRLSADLPGTVSASAGVARAIPLRRRCCSRS